jgi:hypothetical protein
MVKIKTVETTFPYVYIISIRIRKIEIEFIISK